MAISGPGDWKLNRKDSPVPRNVSLNLSGHVTAAPNNCGYGGERRVGSDEGEKVSEGHWEDEEYEGGD